MLKVFLTEDESIVREGLRDNIPWEQYGFEFAGEASDGEMALPMIRKIKPDILITDIKMPFMDGLAFSRFVRKELPNTKIIIISGYDDFEYARQAIELHVDQYLLKPITKVSMIRALELTKRRIEEEHEQQNYLTKFNQEAQEYEYYSRRIFFEKVMEGSLSVQEIYEQAARLEIELDAPGYNIVLFSLQPQASMTAYSESVANLQDALIEYFLRWPEYILFRVNLMSYAILIKGELDRLEELTNRCVENIQRRCSISQVSVDWYVAVGKPTVRLSGLPKCFAETNNILAFRHLMPTQHVLSAEMVEHYQSQTHSYDMIDNGEFDPLIIRNFIQSGLEKEVDNFVDEFFASLSTAVSSMIFQHYLMLSVRINAVAAIQNLGYDSDELTRSLPNVEMEVPDLKRYFCDVLRAAIALRDAESQKQNSNIIENALKYIDQNYSDENISLNTVAKAINISANYLSAVFSQKMGISFVEYLTQKRMAKAKNLLRKTNKRSGEIAYEVGYKDPRYFSFVFKKTQGCTPRDYRAGEKDS